MSQVTLGDLLTMAEHNFEAAERAPGDVTSLPDTIRQLHRLVRAMERFLVDVAPADASGLVSQHDIRTPMRTAADLRQLLQPAVAAIGDASALLGSSGDRVDDRRSTALGQAASALSAGHDLLRGHTLSDPAGIPAPRTPWAGLTTTRPVATALTGEISGWSRRAARFTATLAVDTATTNAAAATALYDACGYLQAAGETSAGYNAGRELLLGIPDALAPPRSKPDGSESVAELCMSITVTAERLRHAALTASRQLSTSPAFSGPAWNRSGHAAAVASDIGTMILQTLARRPAGLAATGPDAGQLNMAATALDEARRAWFQGSQFWLALTTDTQTGTSPATIETGDLVLRMGRLGYDNLRWTPLTRDHAPVRSPASLARTSDAAWQAFSAVHQAADALAALARADAATIRTADRARRLHMRQAILWGAPGYARDYVCPPRNRLDCSTTCTR